jgi:ribosome-associated translation inhibitor RaiA
MSRTTTPTEFPVDVVGPLSADKRRYTVDKLRSLAQYAPIRSARVSVHSSEYPSVERRIRVSATIAVRRRGILHADAIGEDLRETVDLACRRLASQLTHRHHPLRARAYAVISGPAHRP